MLNLFKTLIQQMKNKENLSYLLLLAFMFLFAITNIYWIKEYRFDQLMDIDEAGYLSQSMILQNALKWGGIREWFNLLSYPSSFAPLVPSIASILIYFGGGSENYGLLTNTFLCLFLFITIYQIGLMLSGKEAALVSVLFIASIDAVSLHSRSFNFTIASSLFFALAVLSFIKYASFSNRKWSILLGLSLAFMTLSRTMTIAFLPSFFIVILLSTLSENKSIAKLSLKNTSLSFLVFSVFAIPWYFINFKNVFGYLFSFGYGAHASEYGSALGIFTLKNLSERVLSWLSQYGLMQLLILVIVFFLILLKFRAEDLNLKLLKRNLFIQIGTLILLSFFILFTSRNRGTGFEVPLLIILVPILFSKFFNLYRSAIIRKIGFLVVLFVYSIVCYAQHYVINCNNLMTTFNLPYFGSKTLFDCRPPIIQLIDGNGYIDRLNPSKGDWRRLSKVIADYIYANDSKRNGVTFASRHLLMNVNTVQFELIKQHGEAWPVNQIEPTVMQNTVESYVEWIGNMEKNNFCYVVKLNNNFGEFKPYPSLEMLNSALVTLSYKIKKSFDTPVKGQQVEVWIKDNDRCR